MNSKLFSENETKLVTQAGLELATESSGDDFQPLPNGTRMLALPFSSPICTGIHCSSIAMCIEPAVEKAVHTGGATAASSTGYGWCASQ